LFLATVRSFSNFVSLSTFA